jgi:GH15 family glucan-1,4-alpha-glucosidase
VPAAIGSHVLIGDTRTAALSAADGSLVWMCVPEFDGLPLFGQLVGGEAAGVFRLGPVGSTQPAHRRYRPGSTVAETGWRFDGGELLLTEGMLADIDHRLLPTTTVVRRIEARGVATPVRVRFAPRFGLEHAKPRVEHRGRHTVCSWGTTTIALASSSGEPTPVDDDITVVVKPTQPLTFVLSVAVREPLIYLDADQAWAALETEDRYWRSWSAGIADLGPFHDDAVRSLLTLRLLTYSPSGAPVAAPTTSLPELLGGSRNWDYRFAWPRDAAISVAAFLNAGKVDEARAFMYWLLHATRLDRPRLRPLLTLYGKPSPPERSAPQWPGYADSQPVRFGNSAGDQDQLDVYGWVLDAAWLLTRSGHRLFAETWRALSASADLVSRRWPDPDAGMWEIRGQSRHYVHSKLMAWLALDRALRIAGTRRTRHSRVARWTTARDALAAQIRDSGLDPKRHTYTWYYGSTELDAALLILPLLEFDSITSPQVRGTVDAIRAGLTATGPLLYRYPLHADGMNGAEGAFLPCSFWLVQALARTGRLAEATALFEELLNYGGELGLFAEEVDVGNEQMIGNYPQALTHAALVNAALAIRDAVAT